MQFHFLNHIIEYGFAFNVFIYNARILYPTLSDQIQVECIALSSLFKMQLLWHTKVFFIWHPTRIYLVVIAHEQPINHKPHFHVSFFSFLLFLFLK